MRNPPRVLSEKALDALITVITRDGTDAYLVLMYDPAEGGDYWAYGPLPALEAIRLADDKRRRFDAEDLPEVQVQLVPCEIPTKA